MNIEEVRLKPDTAYIVRGDDHGVLGKSLPSLVKQQCAANTIFIFLNGDEQIEELPDERLAQLGLYRVKPTSKGARKK